MESLEHAWAENKQPIWTFTGSPNVNYTCPSCLATVTIQTAQAGHQYFAHTSATACPRFSRLPNLVEEAKLLLLHVLRLQLKGVAASEFAIVNDCKRCGKHEIALPYDQV